MTRFTEPLQTRLSSSAKARRYSVHAELGSRAADRRPGGGRHRRGEGAAGLQELHEPDKKYPHGIGRANGRDHTAGTPVTTFKPSDRLYRIAMSYNRGLDRDHDGIACETA